jgi:hypothetical protein
MLTSNYTHGAAITWTRPGTNIEWIWDETDTSNIVRNYVYKILDHVKSNEFDGHYTSVVIDDMSVKWIFYANELIMENPFEYFMDKFPEEVEYIDQYLIKNNGCTPMVEFF